MTPLSLNHHTFNFREMPDADSRKMNCAQPSLTIRQKYLQQLKTKVKLAHGTHPLNNSVSGK